MNDQPKEERFGTFERRSTSNPVIPGGQDVASNRFRMLWKSDLDGKKPADDSDSPDLAQSDQHNLSRNLKNSLGLLNEAYLNPDPNGQLNPPQPFAWLTWNNRPYTSALELANVPHTSSYWLSCKFDVADDELRRIQTGPRPILNGRAEGNMITGGKHYSGRYAHLLNFYSDLSKTGNQPDAPWLQRIYDYLEVPSRFSGTESYVNPATFTGNLHSLYNGLAPPFDTISNYRYPGKININTVTDGRVWDASMRNGQDLVGSNYATQVTFNQWVASRDGKDPRWKYANPYRAIQCIQSRTHTNDGR